VTVYCPAFSYSADFYDAEAEAYQPFTRWILFRCCGRISHDTTTKTNVGFNDGQADIVCYENYTWHPEKNSPWVSTYTSSVGGLGSVTAAEQSMVSIDQNIVES